MTPGTGAARMGRVEHLFPPELRDRLLELRRDLHRHPELSFEEHRTAERLEAELAPLRPTRLERVARTGLVARIPGRNPQAPLVAIRGDIDALPIQEETGLEFASETPGVMHACGHDVHASWAVGAAHLLAACPAEGDVLILLQPGEETGKGASAMIAAGALEGVRVVFGAHVDSRFEVGRVVAQAGPLAAATDTFTIELIGRGGHGARPHETLDPIVGAAALVSALQTIVARRLDPAVPGVVSVGTIHGGAAANVIPESVTLTGTLRATERATRERLHAELWRIAEGTAAAHGLESRVQLELGPPPLHNHARAAAWARSAAQAILGDDAVVPLGTVNMAGEDFACFLESIPGCFLRIGAREPGGEPVTAHNPRFYPADGSLFVGAAVLAECARIASMALHERS
jgi:amidohydrolase